MHTLSDGSRPVSVHRSMAAARRSAQVRLPVRRDAALRAGHGLAGGMMLGCSQFWAVVELLAGVIPEPVLAGLERPDQGVARARRVLAGVLRRRGVTAADVAAQGAAAQMEPPSADRQARDAA